MQSLSADAAAIRSDFRAQEEIGHCFHLLPFYLLDHTVALALVFQETILFSIAFVVFTVVVNYNHSVVSLHTLQHLLYVDYCVSHSDWYVLISLCSFDLHVSNN